MSESFEYWCREIDGHLERLGRFELVSSLMPGLPRHESRNQFAQHGLVNTGQLEQLLNWHDGIDPDSKGKIGQLCIMPGFYPLGLQEILEAYRTFRDDVRWRPSWIPFMTDGGGDFMFIATATSDPPKVHRYRSVELEHPVEYNSIESMLHSIATAYEAGAFFEVAGRIELDDDRYAAIAAEINPGISWWLS